MTGSSLSVPRLTSCSQEKPLPIAFATCSSFNSIVDNQKLGLFLFCFEFLIFSWYGSSGLNALGLRTLSVHPLSLPSPFKINTHIVARTLFIREASNAPLGFPAAPLHTIACFHRSYSLHWTVVAGSWVSGKWVCVAPPPWHTHDGCVTWCITALLLASHSVLHPGTADFCLGTRSSLCCPWVLFLTVVGFLVSLCFQMNFSISFSIGTKTAHSDFNFVWVESTDHHRGRRWPNPTERSDFDHKSCISHWLRSSIILSSVCIDYRSIRQKSPKRRWVSFDSHRKEVYSPSAVVTETGRSLGSWPAIDSV